MGQPHCPPLANILGVWSHMMLMKTIADGDAKDYLIEVDKDGRYVRKLEEDILQESEFEDDRHRGYAGGRWRGEKLVQGRFRRKHGVSKTKLNPEQLMKRTRTTAKSIKATVDYDKGHSAQRIICPFPNEATAKYVIRYIDDNKYCAPSWKMNSIMLWMTCYWIETIGLKSTWELPQLGTDGHNIHIAWMDYIGMRDEYGNKRTGPVMNSNKIRKIPHYDSFSDQSTTKAIIEARMNQITATTTDEDQYLCLITKLMTELYNKSVPKKWSYKIIMNWHKGYERKFNDDSNSSNNSRSDRDKTDLVVMDHCDGFDKDAAKRKWKSENGTNLMVATRKHEKIHEALNGIQRSMQKSRFENSRTFVKADNTVDIEIPRQ